MSSSSQVDVAEGSLSSNPEVVPAPPAGHDKKKIQYSYKQRADGRADQVATLKSSLRSLNDRFLECSSLHTLWSRAIDKLFSVQRQRLATLIASEGHVMPENISMMCSDANDDLQDWGPLSESGSAEAYDWSSVGADRAFQGEPLRNIDSTKIADASLGKADLHRANHARNVRNSNARQANEKIELRNMEAELKFQLQGPSGNGFFDEWAGPIATLSSLLCEHDPAHGVMIIVGDAYFEALASGTARPQSRYLWVRQGSDQSATWETLDRLTSRMQELTSGGGDTDAITTVRRDPQVER